MAGCNFYPRLTSFVLLFSIISASTAYADSGDAALPEEVNAGASYTTRMPPANSVVMEGIRSQIEEGVSDTFGLGPARERPPSIAGNIGKTFPSSFGPYLNRQDGSLVPGPPTPSNQDDLPGILLDRVENKVRGVTDAVLNIPRVVTTLSSSVLGSVRPPLGIFPFIDGGSLVYQPGYTSVVTSGISRPVGQPTVDTNFSPAVRPINTNNYQPYNPNVGNTQYYPISASSGSQLPGNNAYNSNRGSSSSSDKPNTNPFPIVVVDPSHGQGNAPAPQVPPRASSVSTIPVASGGAIPPKDYKPQDKPFVINLPENFDATGPTTNPNSRPTTPNQNGFNAHDRVPQSGNGFPGPVAFVPQGPTSNNRPTHFEPDQNSYGDGQDRFGQATPSVYSVTHGIQEFTQDLILTFRNLGISDNVVFSPISVASLLALLTLGTSGVTSQEIVKALGLSNSDSSTAYHTQYEDILRRLNYETNKIIISTASRLFLEETTPVSETFVSQAGEHYNCTVSLENFRERPVQTQTRVNQWVEDATQGKIKDFISSPFSPDTTFVAANTIYFNGAWETPFPVDFTMEGAFDTGVRNISVPMMSNTFDTDYYYSPEFNLDITAIPYVGGELSMIIILPRESPRVKSIQVLERQLDPNAIRDLISKMRKTRVNLSLPRMRLNMKANMVSSLKQLGINSIFSPTTSDFSGLTSKKPIWISQFLHEAIVEITETGTVAAAASGATLDRIGGYQRINVNKPAIIFIRDNVTRLPIFWMRLVQPDRVDA
ncbi:hypothetical protein HAZT_HAZT011152 [Hyalella azteca]|uniref:Alpha-1-antitrypsin n=1 Tax=Hyalella azteca TaxID=294128 RepID=A0A6A0GRU2_HYAAZ|nr:alpha-1-antitrypsin [Hyalella azteca]XP_018009452.1 alpha-1-antitrypsin [Hyalella azteca]KAA0185883.1 hypothetical protein HAZT_HAZT011152 [Hyalella azteca]